MSGAVTLGFRLIEPMLFRGAGEFDPFVRGTFSRAVTLAMPTPSTVAGTLATYCISELHKPTLDFDASWLDLYLSVLGKDVVIRGPFITQNQELLVEDKLLNGFLNMEMVRKKCEKCFEKLKKLESKPLTLMHLDKCVSEIYEKKDEVKPTLRVVKDVRVGVGLETRYYGLKIAKEGFIYGAEYLNYSGDEDRNIVDTSFEIIAEVRGQLVKNLLSAKEVPVKFGGEGRIALLHIEQSERVLDKIKDLLWSGQNQYSGVLALYLATPALFKGGRRIEEYVKEWASDYKLVSIVGESEILGAGFSLQLTKRKPLYTSLKPGSIIFLEGNFDLSKTYHTFFLGEAAALGYGTLLPVPLKKLS